MQEEQSQIDTEPSDKILDSPNGQSDYTKAR